MSESKPYYYMRLKENFFDSDEMIALQSMKDGYLFSDILLKLYLRSLRYGGRLMISNCIPYDPEMISRITNHSKKTVEKALENFKKIGLVEILDSGAIYMTNIQEFIGKSSTEADRKREYRSRIDAEKKDKCPDICPTNLHQRLKTEPELELELELETDKTGQNGSLSGCIIPSFDEVKEYCKGKNIDPEKFYDFNQRRGWMIDGKPIRDWKKIADCWEEKERTPNHTPSYGNLRQYDSDEQPWMKSVNPYEKYGGPII